MTSEGPGTVSVTNLLENVCVVKAMGVIDVTNAFQNFSDIQTVSLATAAQREALGKFVM